MIFSKEDLQITSSEDLVSLVLMAPFVGLVLPFLGAAYTLGFLMDKLGWLDS